MSWYQINFEVTKYVDDMKILSSDLNPTPPSYPPLTRTLGLSNQIICSLLIDHINQKMNNTKVKIDFGKFKLFKTNFSFSKNFEGGSFIFIILFKNVWLSCHTMTYFLPMSMEKKEKRKKKKEKERKRKEKGQKKFWNNVKLVQHSSAIFDLLFDKELLLKIPILNNKWKLVFQLQRKTLRGPSNLNEAEVYTRTF